MFWNKRKRAQRSRDFWTEQNLKAIASERFIANKFRNSGYQVTKISRYDPNTNKTEIDTSALKLILEGHPDKTRLIEYLSIKGKGLPDFCCRRGLDIHFAEVKSNSSQVRKHQAEVLKTLKDMGYGTSTNRCIVNFHVQEMICNHTVFELDARLTDYIS